MKYNTPNRKLININGVDTTVATIASLSACNPEIFVAIPHKAFDFERFGIERINEEMVPSPKGRLVSWDAVKAILEKKEDGWTWPSRGSNTHRNSDGSTISRGKARQTQLMNEIANNTADICLCLDRVTEALNGLGKKMDNQTAMIKALLDEWQGAGRQ